MKLTFALLTIVLVNFIENNEAAKILALFPSPSKSHVFLGQALLKTLAKNGHKVTMVSPYPLPKPVPNYRDIVIQDIKAALKENQRQERGKEDDLFSEYSGNPVNIILKVYNFGYAIAKISMEDKAVQTLLNSNEKFDIVISEIFMNEVFLTFADHFNAKLVAFSTIGTTEWTNNLVGNPGEYAYSPEVFLGFTDHMTFCERIINTFTTIANELVIHFLHMPRMEELRKIHLPHTKPLDETVKNVSLVFLNSHPTLANARPLVPSMIEIGGFHVDAPKSLPVDLKKTLDAAKDGVVYFSMGSNLESKNLPVAVRDAFLQSFAKLKQVVLWKWEEDNLPNQPKNVKISKWFPQQDILAHPNVKLFITHGGMLSTIEAVSRGVPLIGIPVFADQKLNMGKAKALGYGQSINFDNVTEESLTWALNEVLNNPIYTENMKLRSKLLNDRPIQTADEINYWIEYILRHNGAPHLQTARKDLHLYQYLLLDIIGLLLLILSAGLMTAYCIIRCTLRFICSKFFKKQTKISSKQKQN